MSTGPGLQPERTAIAWVRTGMALLVNAVLLAREAMHSGPRGLNFFLLLLSAAFFVSYVLIAVQRARRDRDLRAAVRPLPLLEIRLLAALTTLASATVFGMWALHSF